MSALTGFCRAEGIKLRKSWVLVAMVLAPLCQSGFLCVMLWFSESLIRRFKPGFEFWIELNYLAWSLIFLPILVALVADLSWDLEVEAKAWNLLLIQPVPRRTHYVVKLLSHLALLLVSQLLLAFLLIAGGLLLRSHLPGLMGPIPLKTMLQFGGFTLVASASLVTFHTWLSQRFPGLGIALASALAGTWVCTKLVGVTALIQVLPWGMACQTLGFFDRWNRHVPWEYCLGSLLCAALFAGLGTFDFSRNKEPKG
jgi:hypothetical protein